MIQLEKLALIALVVGAIAIGFSPLLVRWSEAGPIATAFYRVAFAVPVFWVFTRATKKTTVNPSKVAGYSGFVLAGAFFALDLGFWHWSLQYTLVANATLFANLAPIFVVPVAWLFYSERVTILFIAGLALTMAGVVALLGQSAELGSLNILGDILAILAAVFYAGYILTVSRLRRTFTTGQIMTYSSLFSALMLLPVAILSGEQMLATSLAGWITLLALAWVCQASGQGMVTYALKHLPASFSAVTLLLQPAVAAIAAWLLLGEVLGTVQIAGVVTVLLGIILCRWATVKS